jgi:hypothetical protein
MISSIRLLTVSTVLFLMGSVFPVAAQQAGNGLMGRAASNVGVRAAAFATVKGTALNSVNVALPHTMVRLRDVKFGRIVESSLTNQDGAYLFKGLDPGNYIVEIVSTDQTSLASTSLISANAGDTVTTVVRLPFRMTMLANLLGGQVSPLVGGGRDLASELEGSLMPLALQGIAAVVPAGIPISER